MVARILNYLEAAGMHLTSPVNLHKAKVYRGVTLGSGYERCTYCRLALG